MKCSRCGREISEDQTYVNQGKLLCEDCMMDAGLSVHECDPWATYVDKRESARTGLKGEDALTEMEKKVYGFIKGKGKATREEVMKELGLSENDLNSQLITLFHMDMVKEQGQYLIHVS